MGEAVSTVARYNFYDVTANWETTLGRQTLSPIVIGVRGNVSWEHTSSGLPSVQVVRSWGLYVGTEGLEASDIPFVTTSPARFLGFASDIGRFAPRSIADTTEYGQGEDGQFRPVNRQSMGVRTRISKRLVPGDHLYFVTRVSSSLESETQLASLLVSHSIDVLLRIRG